MSNLGTQCDGFYEEKLFSNGKEAEPVVVTTILEPPAV